MLMANLQEVVTSVRSSVPNAPSYLKNCSLRTCLLLEVLPYTRSRLVH